MMNFYEALDLNEKFQISATFVHPKSEHETVSVLIYPIGEMKNRFLWPLHELLGTWAIDQDTKRREGMN